MQVDDTRQEYKAEEYQQRKKKGFHVGDSCFTDVGVAFRPGIIVGVPANTVPNTTASNYPVRILEETRKTEKLLLN